MRTYLVSSGDSFSAIRAARFESNLDANPGQKAAIIEISRARRVGQSWLTTPVDVLKCLLGVGVVLSRRRPDVVVCNGPGTAVVVVGVLFLLKVRGLKISG